VQLKSKAGLFIKNRSGIDYNPVLHVSVHLYSPIQCRHDTKQQSAACNTIGSVLTIVNGDPRFRTVYGDFAECTTLFSNLPVFIFVWS